MFMWFGLIIPVLFKSTQTRSVPKIIYNKVAIVKCHNAWVRFFPLAGSQSTEAGKCSPTDVPIAFFHSFIHVPVKANVTF